LGNDTVCKGVVGKRERERERERGGEAEMLLLLLARNLPVVTDSLAGSGTPQDQTPSRGPISISPTYLLLRFI